MQKVFRITVDISKKIPAPAFEVNTNDLKSVKLEITITNGLSLLDLTDVTPRINIRKPDNEVIFQDCEIVDATAGKVQIVLENQAYLVPGTHTAEIACYKGNEITAITGTFSYKSIKGIMNDKAVESKSEFTAIDRKIEEARKLLEDAAENGVGVDEQARQEIEGLTAQLADTSKYTNQADFVEIIRDRVSYSRARFQKKSNTSILLTLDNKKKHATYTIMKDPNDDFWKIDEGYVGSLGKTIKESVGIGVTTGNFVVSSSTYTNEVGATFTPQKVKGSSLFLRHRKENRGGIWSFIVDGDESNPIVVSTYSATDSTGQETLIIDGLDPNKYHTVKGTFMGDDPNNPPSSGAGTSRGWVNSDVAIYGKVDNPVKERGLLAPSSNKEMAFSIQRSGVTNWVPEHDNIGTAFKTPNYEPQFLLDGVAIDFTNMALNEFVEFTDFKLIQRITAKINNQNVADINLTHHLDRTGVLSWSGNLKVLLDIKLSFMYPLMIPLDQNTLNEALTSIGNSKVSAGDESDYHFPEETDSITSACGLSSNYTSHVAAGTVQYSMKTMRIGATKGKPTKGNTIRFYQRASAPKIYFTAGQQFIPLVGDTYSWFAKVAIAEIPYIYQTLKG